MYEKGISMTLLSAKNLTIASATRQIVKNISFEIDPHETLALVGESGSGKTLTAQSIVRLFNSPDLYISEGSITFCDQEIVTKSQKEMRALRGKEIAFIPQNPLNSLNPTLQVGTQLLECIAPSHDALELAYTMLEMVGFSDCKKRFHSYPNELSGGMRQRLLIAMALVNRPKLVIADEPTTALDVTIQAQILDLLQDLQQTFDTSLLFITHDMGVVARMAHRVAVMKAGEIVEMGDVMDIFYSPVHPYTKELLGQSP
jgi:ABC-type dipeptide/oligopeptide/nickel transport system ATPase component